MRKTTESVREAKDQITEQVNKHVRARRHLTGSEEGKTRRLYETRAKRP